MDLPRVEILSDDEEEAVPATQDVNVSPASTATVSSTTQPLSEAMERANAIKLEGNAAFAREEWEEALKLYGEAIDASASCEEDKGRSIFFANRAACLMALHRAPEAIEDCSAAIKLDPQYVKAMVRRAQAYEKVEKLPEALADYKKVCEIDGSVAVAREGVKRLEPIVKDLQEKQMAEMMSQLKGFGNTLLGKFGLSLDNFKMEKDPATGSYSVQFSQGGAGGEGGSAGDAGKRGDEEDGALK